MKAVIAFFLSLFHIPNLDLLASVQTSMAESESSGSKLSVVVTVVAIIFTGIILYLVFIDRKVSRLEKEIQQKK
jgi:CcmD family protein